MTPKQTELERMIEEFKDRFYFSYKENDSETTEMNFDTQLKAILDKYGEEQRRTGFLDGWNSARETFNTDNITYEEG